VITKISPQRIRCLSNRIKLPPLALALERAKPWVARTLQQLSHRKPNHRNHSKAKPTLQNLKRSKWPNDQAQRQPPESAGGAQGRAPNHPRLANGKRGGCSLQRSG